MPAVKQWPWSRSRRLNGRTRVADPARRPAYMGGEGPRRREARASNPLLLGQMCDPRIFSMSILHLGLGADGSQSVSQYYACTGTNPWAI